MSAQNPGFKRLDYRQAGVDIETGNLLVSKIKPLAQKTLRPEVIGGLGGFGGMFGLDNTKYAKPVLVAATDGVGTKLKLAQIMNNHRTIGIDLVAMCVNDLIVQGAEPLFFLDYFATGKLDVDRASEVVAGITDGCLAAGCALIGGETAEMPGMYTDDDYDLAGFTVGIVEQDQIISGDDVQPGDKLLALGSSGPHSNGYSLIRKIIALTKMDISTSNIGGKLLEPTRIYVNSIMTVLTRFRLKALAHITGGGLTENLPRVMPEYTRAVIMQNSWQIPEIFGWIKENGKITEREMLKTFNCGVGMVVAVEKNSAASVLDAFTACGENCWIIGEITTGDKQKPEVIYV